jgi:hypothetical protein
MKRDAFQLAFELRFGRNRDALRGTEWERFIRWPWEGEPSGPACPWPRSQMEFGL